MTEIEAELSAVAEDFALLDDWQERYGHLIELGRALPPLSPHEYDDAYRVRGCASQVWLVSEADGERLRFRGDSDAHIVKGLIALLLRLHSGRRPEEVLAFDAKAGLARLGLSEALTSQRANGLASMVERIRRDAQAAEEARAHGADPSLSGTP